MTIRETVRPDYDAYPADGIQLDKPATWLGTLAHFTGPRLAMVCITAVLGLLVLKAELPESIAYLGLPLLALLGLLDHWSYNRNASPPKQLEEATPEPGPQRGGQATTR